MKVSARQNCYAMFRNFGGANSPHAPPPGCASGLGYPRAQHSISLLSADITLVPLFWWGQRGVIKELLNFNVSIPTNEIVSKYNHLTGLNFPEIPKRKVEILIIAGSRNQWVNRRLTRSAAGVRNWLRVDIIWPWSQNAWFWKACCELRTRYHQCACCELRIRYRENHSHSKTRLLDYHDSAGNVTNSAFFYNLFTAGGPIASSKQKHLVILWPNHKNKMTCCALSIRKTEKLCVFCHQSYVIFPFEL